MTCVRINEQIDDYLDRDLPSGVLEELDGHIEACADCAAALAAERQLRQALRTDPVLGPSTGFFGRALDEAARKGGQERRRRRVWGAGGALAAGLAVWLVAGLFLRAPDLEQTSGIPNVTMAVNQTRVVNLVFSTSSDMPDAKLTVLLPPGLELEGFEGREEIRWSTSLKRGKNVLPLKVIAHDARGGELFARLDHQDRHKTFKVRVTVI